MSYASYLIEREPVIAGLQSRPTTPSSLRVDRWQADVHRGMLAEANKQVPGTPGTKKGGWKVRLSKALNPAKILRRSRHEEEDEPTAGNAVPSQEEGHEEYGGDQVDNKLTALPPIPQDIRDQERVAGAVIDGQSMVLYQYLDL